jgi:TRAP-type C4-dicarboxylate transport system permease small subunit
VRDRAHIRIDVLFHYVSPKIKAGLYIFGDIVMGVIAVYAFYWSFESVAVAWKYQSVSHGLRVPMVWFFAAVPIGFGLMIYRLIQSLLRDIADLRAGKAVNEGEQLFD